MCIYCGTTKYRRIYESHYGPILTDEYGRGYEVHHIDGNRRNNNPSNLVALSIQEHYNIHYSQQDWGACNLIAKHLDLSSEERTDLARKNALNRVNAGTHNFQKNGSSRKAQLDSVNRKIKDGTFHFMDKQWARDKELNKVANGTHPFLTREDGTSVGLDHNKKRVENGSHNFLGPDMNNRMFENGTHPITKMLQNGTHPAHKEWTCDNCGKQGKGMSQLSRHRKGKNCHK